MFGKEKVKTANTRRNSERRIKSSAMIEETTFVNAKEVRASLDKIKPKKEHKGLFNKNKKTKKNKKNIKVEPTPNENNIQSVNETQVKFKNKKDEPYEFLSKVGIDLCAKEDYGTREYTLWFMNLLKDRLFPAITDIDVPSMQLELTEMVIHEALEKNRTSLPDDLVQDEDIVQVSSRSENQKGKGISNRRRVEVNIV